MITSDMNPVFEGLMELDNPVEECVKAYSIVYDKIVHEAIANAIANKRDQYEADEVLRDNFNYYICGLDKFHQLTMFQFVDTPRIIEDLTELFEEIMHARGHEGCMELLDRRRGRPVEVYYEPSEGEEPSPDDKEGCLDFMRHGSDLPQYYTPEFKEYIMTLDARINDEIASKVTPDTSRGERIRITKEAIVKITQDNPIYKVHRILADIHVPAGHIDVEPDTVKIDGKWQLKPVKPTTNHQ